MRQVEWDVYAGAKDGRLAVVKPDTLKNYQTLSSFYRPMLHKTYEMKDWLGTARLTFSDIKQPDAVNSPKADYTYHLDYLSANTTYPFGAEIDSLSFEKPSFRFGFTGDSTSFFRDHLTWALLAKYFVSDTQAHSMASLVPFHRRRASIHFLLVPTQKTLGVPCSMFNIIYPLAPSFHYPLNYSYFYATAKNLRKKIC